jgi:predicted 2-oxoglutarate/Fe(II)-dependent dioxygenase YbiX
MLLQVRRVEAAERRAVVKFHTDDAVGTALTMQVPLNGDDEYEGGRLVFATPHDGLVWPRRPAGSVTIHDGTIPHGVSEMVRGVRYGLFLMMKTAKASSCGTCGR